MAGERFHHVHIPLDLTVEILKKLPAKSLMRFLCVSKQWKSVIREFIVIDSIVTRSLTERSRDPHLILYRHGQVFSYAYPNEKNLHHEEVLETSNSTNLEYCQYVRGLIGFWSLHGHFTIHNPTTSQSISLPNVPIPGVRFYLFGYDPLGNQYKVVCHSPWCPKPFRVFTLGDPNKQWRNTQCSIITHYALQNVVCINGTIYYKAWIVEGGILFLASFDVRSEEFDHLQAPEELTAHFSGHSTLVNYQGKLGCIRWNLQRDKDVDLWVMEDAKKQEWSKIFTFPMLQDLPDHISILGVTNPGGEIVVVPRKHGDDPISLKVHYYDPKRNRHRSCLIKTTMPRDLLKIWAVTDHIENIMWL